MKRFAPIIVTLFALTMGTAFAKDDEKRRVLKLDDVGEDGLVDVPNLRQRSWRGRVGVGRLCGRLWGVRKACVGRLTSGASPEVTQIRSPVWMSYAATADSTPA